MSFWIPAWTSDFRALDFSRPVPTGQQRRLSRQRQLRRDGLGQSAETNRRAPITRTRARIRCHPLATGDDSAHVQTGVGVGPAVYTSGRPSLRVVQLRYASLPLLASGLVAAAACPAERRDPNETASEGHTPARDLVNPAGPRGREALVHVHTSRVPAGSSRDRSRPRSLVPAWGSDGFMRHRRAAPPLARRQVRARTVRQFEEGKAPAPGGGSDKRASSASRSDEVYVSRKLWRSSYGGSLTFVLHARLVQNTPCPRFLVRFRVSGEF